MPQPYGKAKASEGEWRGAPADWRAADEVRDNGDSLFLRGCFVLVTVSIVGAITWVLL